MSQSAFNPHTSRAVKARLNQVYGNSWLVIIYKLVVFVSAVMGVGLLYVDTAAGWLMLIPGFMAFTMLLWVTGDLRNSSPGKDPANGVADLLDYSLLANLRKENPSLYDVWKAAEKCEERYFFGNRFLIDGLFFENLLDRTEGSAERLWPILENLRNQHGKAYYSNIIVLVGLLRCIDDYEGILTSMRLDVQDIDTAVPWMHDILAKRALARSKRFGGGIGRDWAFGYAPILRNLGHNISRDIDLHGFFSDTSMHQQIVSQMAKTLSSGNGTVTLVGETGVGKTTCVQAFANYLLETPDADKRIRYNQVVSLDAPTLIANAQNPGQLEELMLRIFHEAHKAKNIILFFDDAEVFFGYGSSINLTHVMQPAIESGAIRLILAMTPAAWQQLSTTGATGKLQPLTINPANEHDTLAVLRDGISLTEYRNHVVFTYQALQESYKLGTRYVNNAAMPGAALTVLEQAATLGQEHITKEVVQASVEQTYGIKLQASTQEETSKLLNLEAELRTQVISQDRAVTVVADALRRARSGVGNPNRPVGTFLFLGPTGVGKTELAKALARSYFGNESAIIRVDMNQYVGADDVNRLIQAMHGNELGFLGQVRKMPFTVILLDEIEKAHSSVVNALLQMLDEGAMKDSDNRNVSFKDAIIIATSNAGADEIRQMIDSGENIEQSEAKFVETLISRGFFAPELVNRFDEVVIFKPLKPDELTQVVDIILSGVNKSLASQKVSVELTEEAKKWLVEQGYDPKLGARPMRRMVQRHVENTVAKKLLEGSAQAGSIIKLDVSDLTQAS